MVFNSSEFIVFFAVVAAIYFALPHRFRWVLLLIASYYFYASWKLEYVFLIVLLTAVNYFASLGLAPGIKKGRRKAILAAMLVLNVGVLFVFKYITLFTETMWQTSLSTGMRLDMSLIKILLPVGISFYLLRIMGYAIDVYRGYRPPEKHPGIFALFVSFFPQLVTGPIDRSTKLLPQFHKECTFNVRSAADGLKLMLWGFFQKLVVADTLAVLVDLVFDNPLNHSGVHFTFATILYTFQIYCDFSGYSDIAIGAAQVFGYESIKNFERPYFSKSIPEFWRRWHISLSSWFRDYLYIPLGGNRVRRSILYRNLFIVFAVSGFWHGSNWTFIIWGFLHGFYYIMSKITEGIRLKVVRSIGVDISSCAHKYVQAGITFCLVAFAWIFFRAQSVSDAFYIVSHLFSGWENITGDMMAFTSSRFEFCVCVLSTVSVIGVNMLQRRGSVREMIMRRPVWFRWALYYGTICAILLLGNFGVKQFIYFQF